MIGFELGVIFTIIGAGAVFALWKLVIKPDLSKLGAAHATATAAAIKAPAAATTAPAAAATATTAAPAA